MSAVLGAIAPRVQLPALLFAALAAAVGIAAGADPRIGIGLALAAAFIYIALNDLAAGVAVFTALTFLELAPVGGGSLSLAKGAGAVLAIVWVAVVATGGARGGRDFLSEQPVLTGLLALFVAWIVISALWAEEPTEATDAAFRYALNIALLPILFTALSERRHIIWVVSAMVVGAVIAAGYGIIAAPDASSAATSLTPAGSLNRISGTIGDPNVLAAVLVAGTVLAIAMAADPRRDGFNRWLFVIAALICLTGILSTFSRGGLVSLSVATIAAVLLAGPRRRPPIALVATAIAVVVVGYFAALAPQGASERLTAADGGSGRTDIWQVGWRMVESDPLKGVGAGNFNVSSIHFLLVEPGAIERDEFIVDTPLVAHNVYLELLAETGVVGLALFLAAVGLAMAAAGRAAVRFRRKGDESLELLSRATIIALIALLAADFFISDQFNKQLWLLLALGPALLRIAGRPGAEAVD